MIVVDSSVWIDFLNEVPSPEARFLDQNLASPELVVADLVLCEVLQGLRTEAEANAVMRTLAAFRLVEIGGRAVAISAAANYRRLRRIGVTVCKTVDLLIGAWCIEHAATLLHRDRDYDPMRDYLGLMAIDTGSGPH